MCSPVCRVCGSGHSTEGVFVTDTNSFVRTTGFTEPFLLVTGFTTSFLSPLQNQLYQLCPDTAPKSQPCQSDTVPASTKRQLFQLPQPYPSCHLYTTAAFPCGFLKQQTGCTAQGSQNLDIHLFSGRRHHCLFPWPVLEAAPAERASGEESHAVSSAGETGAAPHGCHLGITP